jgi:hypothetical protein
MTEPMPTTPKANYLHAAIAAAIGLYFIAVGAGLLPVTGGPANLHSPLWILLCAGGAFFLAGRNRHLDALPRQRCRRTADRCAPLVAPLTVSDRGRDLLLLRRDRELGRVRTGRAAVFRNGHDRQRDDRRCGRSHGLRHRRGHDLARHRRGDRPQVSANCSTKTHRARARPEARRVHVTA